MRTSAAPKVKQQVDGESGIPRSSTALTKRANGDIAHVGGVASPGAEYLRSKRTWVGLGSDYAQQDEDAEGNADSIGARMEEGRRGIARGYVVGDDRTKH
jgi:diphthamide biosynthesis protein 2